jgi:hypothetical protein
LKDKWERILEKEGLGDIERNGHLKVHHDQFQWCRRLPGFSPLKNDAKEAYYQLAGEFLHEHRFESEKERKIWELHSLGMPSRQIAKSLREPLNYSRINRQIVKLRKTDVVEDLFAIRPPRGPMTWGSFFKLLSKGCTVGILGYLSTLARTVSGNFTVEFLTDSSKLLAWVVGLCAYVMILTQLLATWFYLRGLSTGSM